MRDSQRYELVRLLLIEGQEEAKDLRSHARVLERVLMRIIKFEHRPTEEEALALTYQLLPLKVAAWLVLYVNLSIPRDPEEKNWVLNLIHKVLQRFVPGVESCLYWLASVTDNIVSHHRPPIDFIRFTEDYEECPPLHLAAILNELLEDMGKGFEFIEEDIPGLPEHVKVDELVLQLAKEMREGTVESPW